MMFLSVVEGLISKNEIAHFSFWVDYPTQETSYSTCLPHLKFDENPRTVKDYKIFTRNIKTCRMGVTWNGSIFHRDLIKLAL
jgi:hypothetical protein